MKRFGKNSNYKANEANIIHNWSLKKKSKSSGGEQIFKDIQVIHKRIGFEKRKYIYLKTPPMPRERTAEWSTLRYSLINDLQRRGKKLLNI